MLQRRCLNGVEILSVDINDIKKALRLTANKIRSEHPEITEIILFGSFSKDDFTPYSDIDIAIMVRHTSRSFIERQDAFIDYFSEIPFDVNLVIYTEDEVKKMQGNSSHFIREVKRGLQL